MSENEFKPKEGWIQRQAENADRTMRKLADVFPGSVPTPASPSSKACDTQESLSKENGGKVETSGETVAGEAKVVHFVCDCNHCRIARGAHPYFHESAWVHVSDSPVPAVAPEDREDCIDDGFGSVWSRICPECKQPSMSVVRPGKVQCENPRCGSVSGFGGPARPMSSKANPADAGDSIAPPEQGVAPEGEAKCRGCSKTESEHTDEETCFEPTPPTSPSGERMGAEDEATPAERDVIYKLFFAAKNPHPNWGAFRPMKEILREYVAAGDGR